MNFVLKIRWRAGVSFNFWNKICRRMYVFSAKIRHYEISLGEFSKCGEPFPWVIFGWGDGLSPTRRRTSHHLNQWWLSINEKFRTKPKWNEIKKQTTIFKKHPSLSVCYFILLYTDQLQTQFSNLFAAFRIPNELLHGAMSSDTNYMKLLNRSCLTVRSQVHLNHHAGISVTRYMWHDLCPWSTDVAVWF